MLRQISRSLVAVLLGLALFTGGSFGGGPSPEAGEANLTVSAAISLKDALDDAKQTYIAANPNVTIAANYGASGSLQLQIEQGAPVDIFLSAAPKQMDALETKGLLLEGTRMDLLRNEVVLIVSKDSTLEISSFQDLTRANVKQIALGEPVTVPAGQYAKEVLASLGIYDAVNAKAVLAKDVRQVLTYVETGNVDAGIVYKTDAMSSTKVKVVATAPAKSHAPVIYPVAVIKASKNPVAARAFLAFLASPQGRAVFQKYGFTSATP
ncbi:MAG TPA: molybdate ABC transporter substrate-binding protein [Candidatus Acidoferrales bacterium]|jgi:molybdate transport system substrate-binding protein|nr:molybdate ABC transporter substrate-binding protein [Candidatus Acidoferrales bacterium]